MELKDYLRVLRKGWVFIVLATLLGTAAAAAYSLTVTPRFEATAGVFVAIGTTEASTTGDLAQGSSAAQQRCVPT